MATKSRPARWAEAVTLARAAHDKLAAAASELEDAFSELRAIQEEYTEWKDNLPENLQSGALADKLEEVTGLDLDWDQSSSPEDASSVLDEAEALDLPRGFGRD